MMDTETRTKKHKLVGERTLGMETREKEHTVVEIHEGVNSLS